jgi:hypothetical protein
VSQIDLSKPKSHEVQPGVGNKARRTVFVYECSGCHKEVRVRASSFVGIWKDRQPAQAVPSRGAIECPHCEVAAAGPTL